MNLAMAHAMPCNLVEYIFIFSKNMKNSMIDFDFGFKDILKWKKLHED